MFVTGITTFNRLEFLKTCVESWDDTRCKNSDWVLIIADDGSTDGSKQWIENLDISGVPIVRIFNDRRGVNYGTNTILRCSSLMTFDLGFKIDDDMVFLQSGWDELYNAASLTPYTHLSFFDKRWGHPKHHEVIGLLESSTDSMNVQGCFWTFDQEVLKKVGYFDPFYGFIGYGDTDYTQRCCMAGFNQKDHPFDAIDSNDYLRHGSLSYRAAISDELRYRHNDSKTVREKLARTANPPSIYVGFNESDWAGVHA